MQKIEQKHYSKNEIIRALHGSSRVIDFRYDLLDVYENKIGELEDIMQGRVSLNSLAKNSKRIGNFSARENILKDVDWLNDRVQPFIMFKMPDGGFIEYPLGIFLLSSPTRKRNKGNIHRSVEVYDGLKILLDDKFDRRYIVRAGTNYIKIITDILLDAGITKINLENTDDVLRNTKEFEVGTEKLISINELLKEINYTSLWVDENGYFTSSKYILPNEREIEYRYEDNDKSVILPGIEEILDLFSVANKFIVVASNPEAPVLKSEYVNQNPRSLTSTYNRKRQIVDYREVEDIANKQALDAYVKRIAYEASQIYGHVNFQTALMPFHSHSDVLHLVSKSLGIDEKYIETSWEMNLSKGGSMRHSTRRVIQI